MSYGDKCRGKTSRKGRYKALELGAGGRKLNYLIRLTKKLTFESNLKEGAIQIQSWGWGKHSRQHVLRP